MNQFSEVEALKKHVESLEWRIRYIENMLKSADEKQRADSDMNALIGRYGPCMNKTEAANLLHVTRTSVYKYIKDGLLEVTGHGMVTTESIARCLEGRKRQRKDERYDEADG